MSKLRTSSRTRVELELKRVTGVSQRREVPFVRHRVRQVIRASIGQITSSDAHENIDDVVRIAEDEGTRW